MSYLKENFFYIRRSKVHTDDDVKELIRKVEEGRLNKYLADLDGSDFGIYLPTYADGDTIKLMLQGYSQVEKNLKISISKIEDSSLEDALSVAWIGVEDAKDSTCKHGGTTTCRHCTRHTGACKHCTKHSRRNFGPGLLAPELDYDEVIKRLDQYKDLLSALAKENFGLSLLHGHNDKFMFTRLPEGYVSVISEGATIFKKEVEVLNDPTFVPNVWRVINGKTRVAGGYSNSQRGEA